MARKTLKKNISPAPGTARQVISVRGACQNNLKNLNFDLPLGKFTVITGPSGSGKSSLAFDTLYAEGQRRYAETFSPYTRQFLERMDKPRVGRIDGIPPAIALSQANSIRTSRSTVGTMTEIADYLKLLMPRKAHLISPQTGREIRPWTPEELTGYLHNTFPNHHLLIGVTLNFEKKTTWESITSTLNKQGIIRHLINGKVQRLDSTEPPDSGSQPSVDAVLTRLSTVPSQKNRLAETIAEAFRLGSGSLWILKEGPLKINLKAKSPLVITSKQNLSTTSPSNPPGFSHSNKLRFSNQYVCPDTGKTYQAPTPSLFTFNNPVGACPTCRGFGRTIDIDYDLALPDHNLSIKAGVVKPFQTESNAMCQRDLIAACNRRKIPIHVPFQQLKAADKKFIIEGEPIKNKNPNHWYGVKGFFRWLETKTYKVHVRVLLARYRAYRQCHTCNGTRYQPEVLNWKLAGKNLSEINRLSLRHLETFLSSLISQDKSEKILLDQCLSRLRFLNQVGLGYLTLDRAARTLSGGEIQRVNLTICLGSSLVGSLFVLDEPSIGLHPRDTLQLIHTLRELTDRGNTTLVVEHDEQFMRSADLILELGPGRGEAGGDLLYLGDSKQLPFEKKSLTGDYLAGRKSIPVPGKRRHIPPHHPHLSFTGAEKNNLKKVDFSLPLRRFTAITGVSGSGKSTLLRDIVYKHLQTRLHHPVEDPGKVTSINGYESIREVHIVDQSPLTKTPRSTPLVYLGCYDAVRKIFSTTDEALSRGLTASSFSFNTGDGRCTRCMGTGYEKISMQFLSDLFITCPVCEGQRFQKHVLDIRWQNKSISDVLSLTIDDALNFFDPASHKSDPPTQKGCLTICNAIALLQEVGLGYLKLGQPLTQLSGGEAQRIKLISHLTNATRSKRPPSNGHPPLDHDIVLILDEPTTGLHFDDIAVLIRVLQRIVDSGLTLLVIEHNLDLIKCADHVVEMGPEAGDQGGQIVTVGTPEQICRVKRSHTATYLKPLLDTANPKSKSLLSVKNPKRSTASSTKRTDKIHANNVIEVFGARHHNLKNITVSIPRNQMVVLTGLSGSGKSTLAFDLLFSEGQRRYLDCLNTYARQFVEQLEKPEVDAISGLPPTVAIEQRTTRGGAKSTVATVTEIYHFLRLLYAKIGVQHDPDSGEPAVKQSANEIVTRIRKELHQGELALLAPLVRQRKGIYTEIAQWSQRKNIPLLRVDGKWINPSEFKALDRYKEHSIDAVVGNISKHTRKLEVLINLALQLGKGTLYTVDNNNREKIFSMELFCPGSGRSFEELDPRLFSFNSPYGWCATCQGYGTTDKIPMDSRLTASEREQALEAAREHRGNENIGLCPDCSGRRLNRIASAVHLAGTPIPKWNHLSVLEFSDAFSRIKLTARDQEIARDIIPEITQRLKFLEHVGLGYLQLDRSAPTLSGGESQRIRLAAQLGSNLQGVLYILDEPTIGLHPRDNRQLLEILTALKNRGNSLVVVEHDEDTMRQADQIIDLGPGAGINGGTVVAQGSWKHLASKKPTRANAPKSKNNKSPQLSKTRLVLGSPLKHPMRGQWRQIPASHPMLHLTGAKTNNLKNLNVRIPRNRFVALSGVSGSGKSTLMHEVIRPAVEFALARSRKRKTKKNPARHTAIPGTQRVATHSHVWKSVAGAGVYDRILEMDQSPIGKTSRSTVATYIGLMDHLRALFASLPMAKARGFDKSFFSYNTGKGRCPVCAGQGTIKIEMSFLPSTYVPCEQCQGRRWTDAVLDVTYKDHSIYDIMELSVEEALPFFENQPKVTVPIKLLQETGLGYLKIGQSSPTLSGGEAQRLKLVAELAIAEQMIQKHILRSSSPKMPENLYLLEEPTVGLHLEDVRKLLDLLHRLVDSGHSVIVIEHHLDVLAEADWILDLGPEGGIGGGRIVAQGTAIDISNSKSSHTAPYLKKLLHR